MTPAQKLHKLERDLQKIRQARETLTKREWQTREAVLRLRVSLSAADAQEYERIA